MGAILTYARPGDHWDWIFPLGLSFYTFQALTYTIDLYRRDAEGTGSLLAHLASVSFFPTILAGPITRVADLVKQFERDPKLTPADGGRAFFLIGLGLLKKFLIADYLAENLVNRVFDTPDLYSGFEVLVGVVAYSLQLYYDFSGYTDIARGAGQLFGVKLPINFDRPYLSMDIAEFWRRWHISFSSWLRDYLYFALPGNRTKVMPYVNLIVTMVLGGLWHGLTWNFAIWGLLHGVALAVVRGWQTWRGRWKAPVPWYKQVPAVLATYGFVCFAWIFFRAGTLDQALGVLRRMGSLSMASTNLSPAICAVLAVAAVGCLVTKKMYATAIDFFSARPVLVHAVVLALIAIAIEAMGGRGSAPFVYSRF
jgi:D-alanyl-lipoteichoic acid acyltransferase DltB (MBOAT superfamily)